MKIQPLSLSFFFVLFIFSCSSIKLKNADPNFRSSATIDSVQFVAVNEGIAHNGKRIGGFVLREDINNDWQRMKDKMTAFAKKNGANLIEVKTIGWGKKGNGFYADGTLYYTESLNEISNPNNGCGIFIRRSNSESVLGTAFAIDITINETPYDLSRKGSIKKMFEDCNQVVTVAINKNKYEVKLNGKSRYFQVAKETSANSGGGVIGVGIGGVSFSEIEDEELARLLMYQSEL